jgi:hypothetical protein
VLNIGASGGENGGVLRTHGWPIRVWCSDMVAVWAAEAAHRRGSEAKGQSLMAESARSTTRDDWTPGGKNVTTQGKYNELLGVWNIEYEGQPEHNPCSVSRAISRLRSRARALYETFIDAKVAQAMAELLGAQVWRILQERKHDAALAADLERLLTSARSSTVFSFGQAPSDAEKQEAFRTTVREESGER